MTTTTNDETVMDQIAMALGGGLIVLGVVVLGLVESLSGPPRSPIADGEIASGLTVDPNIRAGLILVGVIVLLVYAIYAFATQQHLEQ